MILQAQEDLDDDLEKYFGRSSGEVGEGGWTEICGGSGQNIATSNGGSVREIPLGKSRLVKCYILARRIC